MIDTAKCQHGACRVLGVAVFGGFGGFASRSARHGLRGKKAPFPERLAQWAPEPQAYLTAEDASPRARTVESCGVYRFTLGLEAF